MSTFDGSITENLVYAKAIYDFGAESQESIAIEEMSELTKEIVKNWRGEDNADHIAEEIADVEIMLAQLKRIYGVSSLVDEWRCKKLARLARRCHLL